MVLKSDIITKNNTWNPLNSSPLARQLARQKRPTLAKRSALGQDEQGR
jgi:hypothetical protein